MKFLAKLLTDWRGPALISRMQDASKSGIDETTAAMVETAKANAPVITGYYRDNITKYPAHQEGGAVVGTLAGEAEYSLWIDVGSQGRAGRHILRNAFDKHARQLGAEIKDSFGSVT